MVMPVQVVGFEVASVATAAEGLDSNLEDERAHEETDEETEASMPIAMDKSKMTIYLSCNNVSSTKTFCEVKLQVCVSAKYNMIGTRECA